MKKILETTGRLEALYAAGAIAALCMMGCGPDDLAFEADTTTSTATSGAYQVIRITAPSGGDDRPQIQSALDRAASQGRTRVQLGSGTYQIQSFDPATSAHLVMRGQNVVLEPAGSQPIRFVFHNTQMSGLRLDQAKDATVRGIELDYKYRTYGLGTLVGFDEATNTIFVRNSAEHAMWNNPYFSNAPGGAYLTRPQRGNTPAHCDASTTNWGTTWFQGEYVNYAVISGLGCPSGIQVGDRVALVPLIYQMALRLDNVAGATVEHVKIYASPGTSALVMNGRAGSTMKTIKFDDLQITYEPNDTSRWITANGDGVHVRGSYVPVEVVNSLFYGLSDDGINIHAGTFQLVDLRQVDSSSFEVALVGSYEVPLRKGEWFEVYNPQTRAIRCAFLSSSEAYSCRGGQSRCIRATTASPSHPQSCSGLVRYDGTNARVADQVVSMNQAAWDPSSGRGSRIEGNRFWGHRGRAILNHGWNTTIRDNEIGSSYYGRSSWAGIQECFERSGAVYNEGPMVNWPPRDQQVITGNHGHYGNTVHCP